MMPTTPFPYMLSNYMRPDDMPLDAAVTKDFFKKAIPKKMHAALESAENTHDALLTPISEPSPALTSPSPSRLLQIALTKSCLKTLHDCLAESHTFELDLQRVSDASDNEKPGVIQEIVQSWADQVLDKQSNFPRRLATALEGCEKVKVLIDNDKSLIENSILAVALSHMPQSKILKNIKRLGDTKDSNDGSNEHVLESLRDPNIFENFKKIKFWLKNFNPIDHEYKAIYDAKYNLLEKRNEKINTSKLSTIPE